MESYTEPDDTYSRALINKNQITNSSYINYNTSKTNARYQLIKKRDGAFLVEYNFFTNLHKYYSFSNTLSTTLIFTSNMQSGYNMPHFFTVAGNGTWDLNEERVDASNETVNFGNYILPTNPSNPLVFNRHIYTLYIPGPYPAYGYTVFFFDYGFESKQFVWVRRYYSSEPAKFLWF